MIRQPFVRYVSFATSAVAVWIWFAQPAAAQAGLTTLAGPYIRVVIGTARSR